MKLYGSLTSPYVRKARILIREKNIDCEFVVEKPGDPGTRFPQLNPLAKVPVLELDDEQAICWGFRQLGESLGHEVTTASSAEQALELLKQGDPDLIVLDVRLPGMDGLAAIRHFRQRLGAVPIIVITAHGDLNTAVEAVRQGAFE